MINIEINMDSVDINGVFIARPVNMGRSTWMEFWEDVLSIGELDDCKGSDE